MTDGTTGIQVAPITEDEMGKVHDILRRAADAIVGMSQLKHDVDNLSMQVRQLSDDCERLRKANAGLEESLYQARNQRHQLEADLAAAEQAKATAQREAADWQAKANQASEQYHLEKDQVDKLVKERDDAEFHVMELQEKLTRANDMLDKIKAVHAEIVGAMQPAAPSPPPQDGPVVQQPAEASPTPAPEPTPTPDPAEIDWSRPYHWDAQSGRYVND